MAKKQKKEDAAIQVEFNDVLDQVKAAKTVTQNKFWVKGLKERKAELNRSQKKVENRVQTVNMGDLKNVKDVKKDMTELEKAIIDLSDYTKDVTAICQKLNDFKTQYILLIDYFTHTAEFCIEKGVVTLKDLVAEKKKKEKEEQAKKDKAEKPAESPKEETQDGSTTTETAAL
jgi:hypothetical protein